jgi:signal transduction histidine kinase
VTQSLERPSLSELEAMLRRPLGDPRLRLAFWDADAGRWATAAGEPALERPQAGSGLDLTTVAYNGSPGAAIVHDAQLNDDPELLRAAGAVALLAAENAGLDAGWSNALAELRESRARVVHAADEARRKLERNLHDGVQQQLVVVAIDVGLASDLTSASPEVRESLAEIGRGVDDAVDELREIAHGLYPPILSDWGLVAALQRLHTPASATVTVSGLGVGRHPPELESAVCYCCLEAIQNAIKHGGPSVKVSVALREGPDELSFRVTDTGPGFDASRLHEGTGLHNMRDRLGAVDGHISLITTPGSSTTVTGTVPLGHPGDGGSPRAVQTA